MRILFLSNLYPPHHIGGYGMLCLEIVEGLAARGHEVTVLTSTHGIDGEISDGSIHRVLALESDLNFYSVRRALAYPQLRERNLQHLRRIVATTRPDILFIWGMWNLSNALAEEAEALMGERVVYYLANPWPIEPNMHRTYWDLPARSAIGRRVKPLVRIPFRRALRSEWEANHLQFRHALCCSAAQRDQLLDAGVRLGDAPIVYEGIDLRSYKAQADRRFVADDSDTLALLYVGILGPHKGVHTAIEALTHLRATDLTRVRLTILGSGHPQYEERLRKLVETNGLSQVVDFHNPIPRHKLPQFLGRHNVLLLPSIWSEPLARIMQEALAAGMVVVGSATGGTTETITDGKNGLLFAAGDSFLLAHQLRRLLMDSDLRRRLARAGHRLAMERFDIRRMLDEVEQELLEVQASDGAHFECPHVSIIIPTYNHGQWVAAAIRSVLNQSYGGIEVIVVDDGSTDDTQTVVAQFGERVRYIRQQNQGLSAARNTGIRAAHGRYIGVLDADDLYEPDYLATLVPRLDADVTAAAIHCGYQFVDQHNHLLPQIEARRTPPSRFYAALLDGNFLVPESILVRRTCYEAVGLFDEGLRACEDWDVWLRIARHFKIIGTERILTRHRVLPTSMSSDPTLMLNSRLTVLQKHVGSEPTQAGDATCLQRRAYGRAYLGSTVEYLQAGTLDRAADSFAKMTQSCPTLLAEYDTFYQLGLGSQPKGSLGDFAALDLEQNRVVLIGLLDWLYGDPIRCAGLQPYRRQAYALAYCALGQFNYGAGHMAQAQELWMAAIRAYPQCGLEDGRAWLFAKSFLGRSSLEALRRVRRTNLRSVPADHASS